MYVLFCDTRCCSYGIRIRNRSVLYGRKKEKDFFERFSLFDRAPLPTYAFIAIFTLGTMGLSNAAVMRLNYPTHMMFKSCKLIPVMIGSILILGKSARRFLSTHWKLFEKVSVVKWKSRIGSKSILFIFFSGKRYNIYDVLACLCMTIGLIFFTLADSQVQPEFDLIGEKNDIKFSIICLF